TRRRRPPTRFGPRPCSRAWTSPSEEDAMRLAQWIAVSSLLIASTAWADETGRIEYDRYCSWCHGGNGDGRGLGARRFDLPPRDFTTAAFKCRTTPTGALPTDDDLRRSI